MGEWSVHWDKVKVQGKILAFDEISEAPQLPGLYAWYSILGLGAADLAEENQTRSALRRQTSRYKPTALTGEIRGNLGARWAGQLSDKSMDDLASHLAQIALKTDESSAPLIRQRGQNLNRALSNSQTRQSLINTLEQCIPVFLPPLYVGISNNLCSRLQSHVNQFRAIIRSNKLEIPLDVENSELDEAEDTDEASGKSFAMRAIKAGFKEDNLRVYVLPFQGTENMSASQVRNVIGGVEFLLNRWAKPSLGVR